MSDDEVYEYLGQTFEWDRAKARRNYMRHRVMFPEAATVFFDEAVQYFEDPEHSVDEERYIVMGHSLMSARTLYVVHVYRGENIRIVSARLPTAQERSQYETQLGR